MTGTDQPGGRHRAPPPMADREGGVVVITGVMASGKSTVAELLAQRFVRAAHVRGDTFRRWIVAGRVEPTVDMPEGSEAQLMLRYRLAAAAADLYAEAGFVAVVQDIVMGPTLGQMLASIRTRPIRLVVLDPDPDVVAARERARHKVGYTGGWHPARLVDELRRTTPRLGLWLDTSDQTPDQTVSAIVARLDDAVVPA